MFESFISWETLATYAGATTFTALVVQLTKGKLRIPTQLWAYIVAVATLVPATVFTVGMAPNKLLLCLFNAVIVAVAASGSWSGIKRFMEGLKQ